MKKSRSIGVNGRGNRVGETHHRAKLTDHEINLMRDLWEEGEITTPELAEKFDVSPAYAWYVTRYRRRVQHVEKWKTNIKPKK